MAELSKAGSPPSTLGRCTRALTHTQSDGYLAVARAVPARMCVGQLASHALHAHADVHVGEPCWCLAEPFQTLVCEAGRRRLSGPVPVAYCDDPVVPCMTNEINTTVAHATAPLSERL